MKKLFVIFCFLVLVIGSTFVSCEVPWGATKWSGFDIRNNSDITVHTFLSENYPDTLIPDSNLIRRIALSPGKAFQFSTTDKLSKYFSELPVDTLSVFFVSQDTVSKYSWNQIKTRYLILKRQDISLDDLKDKSYLIFYP